MTRSRLHLGLQLAALGANVASFVVLALLSPGVLLLEPDVFSAALVESAWTVPIVLGLMAAALVVSDAEAATFDPAAAASALTKAAETALSCKKPGGPTGAVTVKLTFASNGIPSTVVVPAPFSGTPVGDCVEKAFRAAKIPAFDGAPVAAQKTFELR